MQPSERVVPSWPAADPREYGLKPRLPSQLVVHRDRYSDEGAAELIEQYNSELAAFYDSQGRNTDAASAWTGPVARGAANPSYPDLRDALDAMGFGFDCSSITELILSRRIGAGPEDLMFTSNNTSREDKNTFLREARAAAQLQHRNIVSVHEVGIEGDTMFIVSDFIDGARSSPHFAYRSRRLACPANINDPKAP